MSHTEQRPIWFLIGLLVSVSPLPGRVEAQQPPPATGDEPSLLAILESDAPLFDKAKACQQLAIVGTRAAVPTLAKLLTDEQLAHYARYALEPIPDPAVDVALIAAAPKLQGRYQIGVLQSIGMRRNPQAIPELDRLLTTATDPEVAAAAAWALGQIGSPQAVSILLQLLDGSGMPQPAIADACLTAADRFLTSEQKGQAKNIYAALLDANLADQHRIAALYGALRCRGSEDLELFADLLQSEDFDQFQVALSMVSELPGDQVTRVCVELLPIQIEQDRDARGALLVDALGARGDRQALPAILQLAQLGTGASRLAAVRALARLGNKTAVPVLLPIAATAEREIADAARDSLTTMVGPEIDQAITHSLAASAGPERILILELIGRRRIADAVPLLFQRIDDSDLDIQVAAIEALGTTIGLDQLQVLIDRLIHPKSDRVASAAYEALAKACLRMPDRDATAATFMKSFPSAPTNAQKDFLKLLGVVGGSKALAGIADAARGEDESLHDTATQVLGEWMSPDAAPVLLELAQTGNPRFRTRTLRGYIRIARQLDLDARERIVMCERALEVARRDDEKKLIFDVLKRNPAIESLELVVPFFEVDALKESASAAAVAIAEKIIQSDPKPAAKAKVVDVMDQVVETTGDDSITAQAKKIRTAAGG